MSASRAVLLLATLGLPACTQDVLVGRFRSATCLTVPVPGKPDGSVPSDFLPEAASSTPCAKVIPRAAASTVSITTPSTGVADRTGVDLSERALAAYVTALAPLTRTPEKLRAALAEAFSRPSGPQGIDDKAVFKRTLIVSTRMEGGFNPADRLERTDILIRPYGAQFIDWDLLSTSQGTIDAGSIQMTQTRGASQTLTASTPAATPVTAGLSLGSTQTGSRVEQINAKAIVSNLSATVDGDGNLRITRRGGYGVDLTDNAVIRVTMKYTGRPSPDQPDGANPEFTYRFSGSFLGPDGKPLPSAKVRLTSQPQSVIGPGVAIKADTFLNYTLRHVVSGGDTYEERDDRTEDLTVGPVRRTTTLISGTDTSGYTITVGTSEYQVTVLQPSSLPSVLCFGSYLDARDFVVFLRAKYMALPRSIGAFMLGLNRPGAAPNSFVSLTAAEASSANVRPNCP